jgi:hypothetical protein
MQVIEILVLHILTAMMVIQEIGVIGILIQMEMDIVQIVVRLV